MPAHWSDKGVMKVEQQLNAEEPSLRAVRSTDGLAGEPEWIVNDLGELGVKVGNRFFFLYKGSNIEYGVAGIGESCEGVALHDDGTPMMYRMVGKREFGETQWPLKWIVAGQQPPGRYTDELLYTPGLSDGKKEDGAWKPLPANVEVRGR